MFVGILVLAGVITTVVLFYFSQSDSNFLQSTLIYYITDITLQGYVYSYLTKLTFLSCKYVFLILPRLIWLFWPQPFEEGNGYRSHIDFLEEV